MFKISWHVPEIVLREREYQMQIRAMELLPGLNKLEKVIGHNLAITEEIIKERIRSTIAHHLTTLGLNKVPLAYGSVDWEALVTAAVERGAPFDPGQKEKGFRDALAIETFLQAVSASPKTPSVCRLAFVTTDARVREALAKHTATMTNIRILEDLNDLKNLINTLASEVPEEYVSEIRDKAKELFFISSEFKDTLYYTEDLFNKIKTQFKNELAVNDPNASIAAIRISPPKFVSKLNSTINWESVITFDLEVKKTLPSALGAINTSSPSTGASAAMNALQRLMDQSPQNFEIEKQKYVFIQPWSCRVNDRKQLSAPKLGDLSFSPQTV